MKSFSACVQELLDAWISGGDGANAISLYQTIAGPFQPDMVLAVVDCTAAEPLNFVIKFVRRYSVATRMSDCLSLQETYSFGSFPDQKYLENVVSPKLTEVLENQRPSLSKGMTTVAGAIIAYEQLLIPQRRARGRSEWCIALLQINRLLPQSSRFYADSVDGNVLQLLSEGLSHREIGLHLQLSYRTVEHRLERLKRKFGARNLQHLVVLWIAGGLVI